MQRWLGWVLTLVALVAVARAEDKEEYRTKLETAIPRAIKMLEAGQHADFLKAFVTPDEMKKITERVTFEEFAAKFGERKAAALLATLRHIEGKKPTHVERDGNLVTYELPEDLKAPGNRIKFVRIDNLWYIKN